MPITQYQCADNDPLLYTGMGRLILTSRMLKQQHFDNLVQNALDDPSTVLFTLETWFDTNDTLGRDVKLIPNGPSCGTVCCAIGYAANQECFNKLGLYLSDDYDPVNRNKPDMDSWLAIEDFFDMPTIHFYNVQYLHASILFSSMSYTKEERTDPIAVANRILEYVADPEATVETYYNLHHAPRWLGAPPFAEQLRDPRTERVDRTKLDD